MTSRLPLTQRSHDTGAPTWTRSDLHYVQVHANRQLEHSARELLNDVQAGDYCGSMPRETLTREHIVTVAIDLLDAEGLEGLNMRALGRRLDSAATAVYWHVGSKDNLIALAGDQVWSEITLPDLDLVDWRTAAVPHSHRCPGHTMSPCRLPYEPGQPFIRTRHDDPFPRTRLAQCSSPHPRYDLNIVQVQLRCPIVGSCRVTR